MRFFKLMLFVALAMFVVSCSKGGSGADYDACLKKAKEAMVAKGVPEAQAGPLAEQSCVACKENEDACKAIIDAL